MKVRNHKRGVYRRKLLQLRLDALIKRLRTVVVQKVVEVATAASVQEQSEWMKVFDTTTPTPKENNNDRKAIPNLGGFVDITYPG